MKVLSTTVAGKILTVLLMLLIVMHLLALLRVLPYEVVCGGRIEDASSLAAYETNALIITVLFLVIVSIKVGYIKADRLRRVADVGMWIVFAYFAMNIVSNLASGVSLEKLVFVPIWVILALLSLRVAVEQQPRP